MLLEFVMQEVKCLQEQMTFDDDLIIGIKYEEHTTLIATMFEHL